jgi:PAS domain S-box-containing protein
METFRNGIEKNIKAINVELNLIRKDGSSFIGELNGTKVIYGNQEWILVVVRDITERKRVQDALRESEELYRNLVLMIPDGVYKTTAEGKFIDVNPAMVKMLGYDTKEELMTRNINSLLYFDALNYETRGKKQQNEEMLILKLSRKDGSEFWVEDHGWYNFDDQGMIISHEGVLRDITERKLTEEALEEKMNELMRFQRLTVGRELTMIELKKEVNELLKKSGSEEKYIIFE